jgi:hypothetical protein
MASTRASKPAQRLTPLASTGTFITEQGVIVDARGVGISFQQLQSQDDTYFAEVLGKSVETPAELLKAVALDPRQPLARRLACAKDAAPYFDKKTPVMIETPAEDPTKLMDLSKLTDKELGQFLVLAEKLGLSPTEKG